MHWLLKTERFVWPQSHAAKAPARAVADGTAQENTENESSDQPPNNANNLNHSHQVLLREFVCTVSAGTWRHWCNARVCQYGFDI